MQPERGTALLSALQGRFNALLVEVLSSDVQDKAMKTEAVRKVVQCTRCMARCARCGVQFDIGGLSSFAIFRASSHVGATI